MKHEVSPAPVTPDAIARATRQSQIDHAWARHAAAKRKREDQENPGAVNYAARPLDQQKRVAATPRDIDAAICRARYEKAHTTEQQA